MYSAVVTKLKLKPHPNADKLLLATTEWGGYQVVVGKETVEGELGLFFPGDGALSKEFAEANDLLQRVDENGNKAGGYFSPKTRRVREQNFRGERSEGFWCPLSYLAYINNPKIGADYLAWANTLKQGDTLYQVEIDDRVYPICNKYITPATAKAQGQVQQRKANPLFLKHVDTEQYKNYKQDIPLGSVIYVTEKLHGTSGRTGHVKALEQRVRLWDRLRGRNLGTKFEKLTGTRNTVLRDPNSTGYHGSDAFRHQHSERFAGLLNEGETVYYEIVGFANGAPIMSTHDTTKLNDKKLRKQYGDQMVYSYGCVNSDPLGYTASDGSPENDIYVYRITVASGDDFVELSWPQVQRRAKQLGLKTVPYIGHYIHNAGVNHDNYIEMVSVGPSSLDKSHIREGVVLRIEDPNGDTRFLKNKSFDFRVLEGIAKERDDVVDMEESS